MNSGYFLKKISGKLKLFIGIIIVLLSVLFQYLIVNNYYSVKNNAKQYENAKDYGEYVYVDVTGFTDYFATEKKDSDVNYYYFISDGTYLYIANIKKANLAKLPGRLYGYTSTISSDLAKIAKDEYNEYSGSEQITDDNLYNIFGIYYIDATKTPKDDLIGYTICNGIFFIIGVIVLISYKKNNSKNNKILSEYGKEKIIADIDKVTTTANRTGRLYLTDNYILSFRSIIEIIQYRDIVWMYPHTDNYNGRNVSRSIMLMDIYGKMHSICNMPTNKNKLSEYNEIYENLENRIKDVLSGYTAENKEKAYEIVNKFKR